MFTSNNVFAYEEGVTFLLTRCRIFAYQEQHFLLTRVAFFPTRSSISIHQEEHFRLPGVEFLLSGNSFFDYLDVLFFDNARFTTMLGLITASGSIQKNVDCCMLF